MVNLIGQLASGIVQTEFDYITGPSSVTEVTKVSGWLGGNVGQLNTLLFSHFGSGDLSSTSPKNPWKQEEQAIYSQVYLRDYYSKQARLTLRLFTQPSTVSGSAYTMTPWTTLKEGDTSIAREAITTSATSRTHAANTFKSMSKDADEKIRELVYKYNSYQSAPRQVAGADGITGAFCYS
jgi:hypothetical protein